MFDLNYDSEYDILYVSIGDKKNSYGDEIVDGFVVMKDIFSEKVTGFTIFGFSNRCQKSTLSKVDSN